MTHTDRRDWIQADLRCLMCGRVAGRLVGPAPAPAQRARLHGRPPRFVAFRPTDPDRPAQRLSGDEQFRCPTCGGRVIMDALETFATYPDLVAEDLEDEERPRRGRPPKPWRSPTGTPTWLDELGIAG